VGSGTMSGMPTQEVLHPGRTLRSRRKALGITRLELARIVGCSSTMLGELEAGVIPKSGRVLPAVLDVLDRREAEAQVSA
jgi:transcriptional regulator with XRE-family HTH domain